MKVELKAEHTNILVDALKVWIQHYEERGFGPEHAIIAASMIIKLNGVADTILDNADNEPEEKEDETLVRNPNPGEHFVMGKKGYQKQS